MSTSYPTVASFIFDVPEPESISATFQYNYFMTNERVEEGLGNAPKYQTRWRMHKLEYPRYVNVSFNALGDAVTLGSDVNSLQISDAQKQTILQTYASSVNSELEYLGRNFGTVLLQDQAAAESLQSAVEAALLLKKVDTANLSPLETVLQYSSITSDKIDGQAILDSTSTEGNNTYTYLDPTTGEPFEVQKSGDVGNLSMACTLNKKIIHDVLKNAEAAALSPLYEQVSTMISQAETIQQSGIASYNDTVLSIDDYEPVFNPVAQEKVDTNSICVSGNQLLGYLIHKWLVKNDGTLEQKKSIIISNPDKTDYQDDKVFYGQKYRYSISTVYIVRLQGVDSGGNLTQNDVLISSRQSPYVDVKCVEAVPPDPPLNLRFWLTQARTLTVEWDFPYTSQEDIKRFQIFRRNSLEEPFTLIKEIDFDDSEELTTRSEVLPDYSTQKIDHPICIWIDPEFELDSKFIYAVCSVDAHDLSSPYSEQFQVSWDRAQGKVISEFLCYIGSPKPYPNFNLKETLTVDSIRDSMHSSLTVYFDPEYLIIKDSESQDLDHLVWDKDNPTYKLQLINVDWQVSNTYAITIWDKR
tara:strand:- start:629 stop:2377 length:1749 start_codon:yes stop_codon:yes gene_type:complete